MICDGNSSAGVWLSRIRIFRPVLDDRLMTLRHETGHVRYHFVKKPPASLEEATALFRECEPNEFALYEARGEGFDICPESVVRLADWVRDGRHVPPMSPELSKLVRDVVRPAPASALAFVAVAFVAVALVALAALLAVN